MFSIDNYSEIPIYLQIRNGIIKEIANGNLKNGDKLPSIRQLAKDFEINPMTINKAYSTLKSEKIIEIDRRSGAYISVKCDEDIFGKIEDNFNIIIDEVLARGMSKEEILEMLEKRF